MKRNVFNLNLAALSKVECAPYTVREVFFAGTLLK